MTLPKNILKSWALRVVVLVAVALLTILSIVASFMDGPWTAAFLTCLGWTFMALVLIPGAAIVGIVIAAVGMEVATYTRAFFKWRRWGGKFSDYID